ncbi:hypothetical protein GF345_02960 [Candidatus Woesearchaeota archaeon]|nr:hypothetical protein [Candidatus Woesearchaeota archaeon]
MRYKNLILIGTSHIARQSIDEVRNEIRSTDPDIVAVELDANRYQSLKSRKKAKTSLKDIFRIGILGFFFALLGKWAQNKMGKLVGVMPGTEMLTAIRAARKSGADIKLIDQNILITLRRLSHSVTWKERFRFVYDLVRSVIFRKSEMKRLGIENLDLTKVPPRKLVRKLTMEMKKNYPNVYNVLVAERNEVMASRLARLMQENREKKILAVVGAGHEEELLDMIKKNLKNEGISYSFTVNSA